MLAGNVFSHYLLSFLCWQPAKRVSHRSNSNLNLNIDNVIFSSPDRDIAGWNRNLH